MQWIQPTHPNPVLQASHGSQSSHYGSRHSNNYAKQAKYPSKSNLLLPQNPVPANSAIESLYMGMMKSVDNPPYI